MSSRRSCRTSLDAYRVAGLGCTGLLPEPANEPKLARLAAALGL